MSDIANELVWDRQMVERYWRYIGQYPENYFSFHRSKDVAHQTRRFLPRNARVVDYGCGPGYLIPALLDAGYRVTGADLSSETIGLRLPNISERPSFEGFRTITDLRSAGEKFDAAYLIEVVEHLYDAELSEALDNIRSLLRPGGVLIVTTPNEEDLSQQQVYCPVSNVTFHKWQHVRSWNAEALSSAIESRGYSIKEARCINFRGNRSMSSPLYRAIGAFLARTKAPISLVVVATSV